MDVLQQFLWICFIFFCLLIEYIFNMTLVNKRILSPIQPTTSFFLRHQPRRRNRNYSLCSIWILSFRNVFSVPIVLLFPFRSIREYGVCQLRGSKERLHPRLWWILVRCSVDTGTIVHCLVWAPLGCTVYGPMASCQCASMTQLSHCRPHV